MLSKNEVKYIQSLYHKKQRQAEGLFIAENPKLVEELLLTKFTFKKIYALASWIAHQTALPCEVVEVTAAELERISQLQTPNQVLAIVAQVLPKPLQINNTVSLVLDGIQDPGNMGTLIRIADWFNIPHVICSPDTVELYNPKVVQSTMGSIARVQVHYQALPSVLAATTLPIYGALLQGKSVYDTPKIKEGLVIIGSEGNGISDALLPYITHPITIPKRGGAESLNAGIAAGIIISHLV